MSGAQNLRVIGSRSIFQLFLPSNCTAFRTVEFLHTQPEDSVFRFLDGTPDRSLTLIVNPEDYDNRAINTLRGDTWLWFLRPLVQDPGYSLQESPRLLDLESRSLERRRFFLSNTDLTKSRIVVVSDEASYAYCQELGMAFVLSPPPVSDVAASFSSSDATTVGVWADKGGALYTRHFVAGLPPEVISFHGESVLDLTSTWPSHWIVPGEAVSRTFPYEAAVCLRAGKTLITGHLWPRWGLEPGIDYFEYSTPEELLRITESVMKYPQSTRLMGRRGLQKSLTFGANRIYERIFSLIE